MCKATDELLFWQPHQVALFFQILHQGISLFFDVREMAETGITLIDIHFTQMTRPVKDVLVKLPMNRAQMRQAALRRAQFDSRRS